MSSSSRGTCAIERLHPCFPYVLSYAVLLVAGQTLFVHDLYCLSGLCRPYGAKTIGVSFYPPLTQWATVVAPRRGAFVMPR